MCKGTYCSKSRTTVKSRRIISESTILQYNIRQIGINGTGSIVSTLIISTSEFNSLHSNSIGTVYNQKVLDISGIGHSVVITITGENCWCSRRIDRQCSISALKITSISTYQFYSLCDAKILRIRVWNITTTSQMKDISRSGKFISQ